MNIVKHSKDSNSPHLRKRPFLYEFLPALLSASLLGTYLDLLFVGAGVYEFPTRPLHSLFSINIFYPLVGLPFFMWIFLLAMKRMSKWMRGGFILFLSSLAPSFEKLSENWGFFSHREDWHHIYSLGGYLVFFIVIWGIYSLSNRE